MLYVLSTVVGQQTFVLGMDANDNAPDSAPWDSSHSFEVHRYDSDLHGECIGQ